MRYKKPYTVFPRHMKSGKIIWYYQTYNSDGQRTVARSTGQTTKTAALFHVARLHKEDKLIPTPNPYFRDWAVNWWIWDRCPYVRSKLARGGRLSRSYVEICRQLLDKHILPVFGAKRLCTIKPTDIEQFLLSKLYEGLSASSVNNLRAILSTMFREAVRLSQRKDNPVTAIPKVSRPTTEKGIFTQEEASKILNEQTIPTLWQGNLIAYTANLLAATGGLRLGEVLALQVHNLRDGQQLTVEHSWDERHGLKTTKTGKPRTVPIPEKTIDYLKELTRNGGPFLFGGKVPLHKDRIRQALYRAIKAVGIDVKQRKLRRLSFHSWRHYYNTTLRGRISDSILRQLTGHSSEDMTDHYTHLRPNDLSEVREVIEKIFG